MEIEKRETPAAVQPPIIAAVAAGRLPLRGGVGNFVVALTQDGRVTACDLPSGQAQVLQPQMPEIPGTSDAEIISVTLAPEGFVLAAHGRRGLAVWDIGNPRALEIPGANISGSVTPRWAPGARRFSILTQSRDLVLFGRNTAGRFENIPVTLPVDKGSPLDVAWVTGNLFLVGLDSGKVLVYQFSKNHEISVVSEVSTHHQVAFKLALTSGKLAVAGNLGVDLFALEIAGEDVSVRHLMSLGGHKDLVSELAWSEDELLATACDGGVVNVWTAAGTKVASWDETPAISALVWVNGQFLVVGLERGKVRVYEGVSGAFCEEIGNEDVQVEDVAAVLDETSGTAFLAVLGVNSRSLRVASRKLDLWINKTRGD